MQMLRTERHDCQRTKRVRKCLNLQLVLADSGFTSQPTLEALRTPKRKILYVICSGYWWPRGRRTLLSLRVRPHPIVVTTNEKNTVPLRDWSRSGTEPEPAPNSS